MPDGLYDLDILTRSEHQADLLRRLAPGEPVNDVDWAHIVEEIEDAGLSELNAVKSHLRQMLLHLLKLAGWPDHASARHWREEIAAFQAEAAQRFAPSMRRRFDPEPVRGGSETDQNGGLRFTTTLWPGTCLLMLDALLNDGVVELEQDITASIPRCIIPPVYVLSSANFGGSA
jgi:hypothetical protein